MGAPPSARRLGLLDGLGALLGGLGFVVRRPGLWGLALVPVLAAGTLFVGLGAVALWGAPQLAARALSGATAAWAAAAVWAVTLALWLVGLLVSFLLAISLAQPLSGFALDAIARRQEVALGGRAWPEPTFLASALRSLRVSLVALALTLPALGVLTLVTLLVPPASVVTVPLKLVVTGLGVAYDLLDYPLSLRSADVGPRLRFLREHLSAVLGFGLAVALLLLIPGMGLLVLPFGVAGATRLVVQAGPPR